MILPPFEIIFSIFFTIQCAGIVVYFHYIIKGVV